MSILSKAGVQGFEPQSADPESAVLPLNDTPIEQAAYLQPEICEVYDTPTFARCQAVFWGTGFCTVCTTEETRSIG
jgi:hypothetical protein